MLTLTNASRAQRSLLGSLLALCLPLAGCVDDKGVGGNVAESQQGDGDASTQRDPNESNSDDRGGADEGRDEPGKDKPSEAPSSTADREDDPASPVAGDTEPNNPSPVDGEDEPSPNDEPKPSDQEDTEDTAPPRPPGCGDAVLDEDEECDEGDANGVVGGACTDSCKVNICGDGLRGPDEDCDDANRIATDSCDLCRVPAIPCACGDGVVDEECDECDEGAENGTPESACTEQCRVAVCGDGLINNGELCDDGAENGLDGYDCTIECTFTACGDGQRGVDEECDDGNNDPNDECDNTCLLPLAPGYCGDGNSDLGEQCDEGAENGVVGSLCTALCLTNVCGDGHRGPEETCDDGNLVDDDSCPNTCGIEQNEEGPLDAGTDAGDAGRN